MQAFIEKNQFLVHFGPFLTNPLNGNSTMSKIFLQLLSAPCSSTISSFLPLFSICSRVISLSFTCHLPIHYLLILDNTRTIIEPSSYSHLTIPIISSPYLINFCSENFENFENLRISLPHHPPASALFFVKTAAQSKRPIC